MISFDFSSVLFYNDLWTLFGFPSISLTRGGLKGFKRSFAVVVIGLEILVKKVKKVSKNVTEIAKYMTEITRSVTDVTKNVTVVAKNVTGGVAKINRQPEISLFTILHGQNSSSPCTAISAMLDA